MADQIAAEGTPASATDTAPSDADYRAGLEARLRNEAGGKAPGEAADGDAPPAEDKPAEALDEPVADEPDDDAADDDDDEGEVADVDPVDKDELRRRQKERRSLDEHKTKILTLEREVNARAQQVQKGEAELVSFMGEFRSRPVATLLKHGLLDQADIDHMARDLTWHTTEAKKDPRTKGEAERRQREREREIADERRDRELQSLKARDVEREQAADGQRQASAYAARIDATLPVFKGKTPLLAKAMEKDAAETKRELYEIAHRLAVDNGGRFAEPGKVLLSWEKQQRARMERLGLSVPTTTTTPAKTAEAKAKTPTAAKSQGQPATATTTDPDIAASVEEYRAGLAKRLKATS